MQMAAPPKTVCIAPAALANNQVTRALWEQFNCLVKVSQSASMSSSAYIFPQSSVAFFLVDVSDTAAAPSSKSDDLLQRIAEFARQFAHCYVLTVAAPGNARHTLFHGEVQTRCIVEIIKPIRFLFATSPHIAARIMFDIARATAKEQRKTVIARFESLLQERQAAQTTTWVLNALAQVEPVEPSECLLLQQVASLSAVMRADWHTIYDKTAVSREAAMAVDSFFKGNTEQ